MSYMMYGWSSMGDIDVPINTWNIDNVTTMSNMFAASKLTTARYDSTLIAWEARTVKPSVPFHAGTSKYSAGAATTARGVLTGTDLWTITDGGQV